MDEELQDKLLEHIDNRLESTLDTAQSKENIDIETLSDKLEDDPMMSAFNLDHPDIIFVKLASGATTSAHKIIGHLFEDWVEELIEYQFRLTGDDIDYSEVVENGNEAPRNPDPVVLFDLIDDTESDRLLDLAQSHDSSMRSFRDDQSNWRGIGLELKNCLQSNDSTRKSGIKDTGDHLSDNNILPVMLVFCSSSNSDVINSYQDHWKVLEGEEAFEFLNEMTGHDLLWFIRNEQESIDEYMDGVVSALSDMRESYTNS